MLPDCARDPDLRLSAVFAAVAIPALKAELL
jgi:hypothetical protein